MGKTVIFALGLVGVGLVTYSVAASGMLGEGDIWLFAVGFGILAGIIMGAVV